VTNTLQTIRGKVPSKRVLLAVGGAAAIALGAVQTADTMAASTDSANAEATQIATENYFPTPLPSGQLACSSPKPVLEGANLSWASAGPGMSYKVTAMDGSSIKEGPFYQTDTSRTFKWNYKGSGTYHIVVQVVNAASGSGAGAVTSSGELRHAIYHDNLNTTKCTGSPWRNENDSWENQRAWTPATAFREGRMGIPTPGSPELSEDAAQPSTTTPQPSESADPTPSTPEPSGTEPSASAPSTPETSTPETSTTKPSTPESSETETPAKITVSVGAAGEASGFTVYKDGVESCFADKAPTDNVSVGNGEVVLTTADGAVKKVDPDTCKVS